MFLKSLEIQGFKSFADKVHFDFSPGVTAIVGPNGSGKSNVVDAIRWVLGEQSVKTLRGSKMEDVIFSGSVDRKPVGMARVTMVLDNSMGIFPVEYKEVEVSRTLHRSGESTYQLNKSVCRLKDIHELFMDTGLGKDGFSVIGQGKIEEILTLKAEERRGLIEEAAGISKYKYRKIEAERKLAATNEDMTRLDDLLFELEERLEPLSIQAEKVKKYRALKEEEEALQLAFLSQRYIDEQKIYETNHQAVEALHEKAIETQTLLNTEEAKLTEKKVALDKKRQQIELSQNAFVDVLREVEKYEKESSILDERSTHTEKNLVQTEKELSAFLLQKEKAEALYQDIEKTLSVYEMNHEKIAAEVNKAQESLLGIENKYTAAQNDIKALQGEQFEVFSRQAANNNERTRLLQALTGDQARHERLESRLSDLDRQRQLVEKDVSTHQKESEQLNNAMQSLGDEVIALSDQTEELSKSCQAINQNIQTKEQEYSVNASRLATLKEFEEGGEGYFQGVQAVLQAKKQKKLEGVLGSVLQLLEIPPAYLTAIDNTLGSASQNIVVENDQAAQLAIQWLKKEKRGRATFMPLNLVKGRRQDIQFNNDAVVGLALDLVSYDAKYEAVMAQLLGHVWVLKDLASATALAKKTGSKYRFVTLDGDVIAPGGMMTGGHSKKRSSIVFRKNEMVLLKNKIEQSQNDVEDLKKALAISEEKRRVNQQLLQEKQQLLQEKHLQSHALDVLLKQSITELERIKKEEAFENYNKQELNTNKERSQDELSVIDKNAKEIEALLKSVEEKLVAYQVDLPKIEAERRSAAEFLQNKRVLQAAEEEKYQTQKLRFIEIQERCQSLLHQVQEKTVEKTALEASLADILKETELCKTKLNDAMVLFHSHEGTMAEDKNQLGVLEGEAKQVEKKLGEIRRENESVWREYNKVSTQLERSEEHLLQVVEQLNEDFQLTPEAAIGEADLTKDLTNAAITLKKLKQKMDHLGEINFTALEEYQVVKERAAFLDGQIQDLHTAKEKLETIIHDMEVTMAESFKVTYEKINDKFTHIFTEMFNGGQARLELSMPGRYLETGVEIIAQPPGKNERVLTLLSGGERALTATALLFALLEVRPSPFVILDEIEAALDEANVERFAAFIKTYAERTQFIVISHRKGTMEAAAVLYGITMDNNGVSKQVSVRLTDFLDEEG